MPWRRHHLLWLLWHGRGLLLRALVGDNEEVLLFWTQFEGGLVRGLKASHCDFERLGCRFDYWGCRLVACWLSFLKALHRGLGGTWQRQVRELGLRLRVIGACLRGNRRKLLVTLLVGVRLLSLLSCRLKHPFWIGDLTVEEVIISYVPVVKVLSAFKEQSLIGIFLDRRWHLFCHRLSRPEERRAQSFEVVSDERAHFNNFNSS